LRAQFSTQSGPESRSAGPGVPLSRRVSRAKWERALRAAARARTAPGWTSMTVAVAGRLASYMGPTGGNCFPGIRTLAGELLSKPQTVAKHIRLLEAGGYLEVHKGGGRGRRTEYYARLPVDVALVVPEGSTAAAAPAAAVQLPAEPARPAVDVALVVPEGSTAAAAPAAAVQLPAEPARPAVDVALVVPEGSTAAAAPAAAVQLPAEPARPAVDVETVSLGRRGGVGGSEIPSCSPGTPGAHAARSGGTRLTPRPTRPARVPAPVARVIVALPLTEQQRLWVRTWAPAVEAIAAALRDSGVSPAALAAAIDGAREWPLRDARYPGSALVARMPAALELLAVRAAAEARRRELGAAPPAPVVAKARREVVEASAAAARAAIAAAPDPKAPGPARPWASSLVSAPGGTVSRRPRRMPLPELLARLEARDADAGEDPSAAVGA
jgi:Helix-turn-helix domain